MYKGYKCTKCGICAHKECLGLMKNCGVPIPPPRPRILGQKPTSQSVHQLELERYPWYVSNLNVS